MYATATTPIDILTDLAQLPQGAPITHKGNVIGYYHDDESARTCRLGPISPDDPSLSRTKQTESVFQIMADALSQCDMRFTDIARTWFYIDDLLDWYDTFNNVRTAFFEKHGTFDKMVPASTGIGVGNPKSAALVAGLVAIRPHKGTPSICAVDSPLQGSALDYRSSFSRAVEVATPSMKTLHVSGTASIDQEGESVHIGDPVAQISLTMDVVTAILKSRGMQWDHATRGIVYYPDPSHHALFSKYCSTHNIPEFPLRILQSDVCRRELLFEIEIDAKFSL